MLNYIKKLIKNENKNEISLLDKNLIRFEYISNSISQKKKEILEAHDTIGGYYNNKIILPKNIKITTNELTNIKCFLYKILFSTISNNKNYYLPENKNNLNYILLASMITVKSINTKIKKLYPNFKNLIKELHPVIIKNRKETNNNCSTLLELILKKLMYEKHKKNKNDKSLNNEEKLIIYEIENIENITTISFIKKINSLYLKFKKINKNTETINLNILWGYMYYKKTNKNTNNIQTILKNKKHTNQIIMDKNTITHIKKINKKTNINHLNSLFDYKKTTDNYKHGNKNNDDNNNDQTIDLLKKLDLNTNSINTENNTSLLKKNILNNITTLNINIKNNNFKKYPYKEWNFKLKQYKNNWCNIFVKKEYNYNNDNELYINNIKKTYKNDIKKIREKISLITNEKIWKKKQVHGEDIDFDTIIDNYTEIKNEYFNKVYKFKKKYIKNISIIILFDSSLSTDGYINQKKIIECIKEITIILTNSIKNDIPEHLIATFYSNTRHDCTYKIIKEFKEKDIKNNIKNINSNGYTRIGPAIRHSITKLKKMKNKKKIIIVLTDGNPTDYDEYEGLYGINDIKMAIKEAKKLNISINCIVTNNKPDKEFITLFKKYNLNIKTDIMCKQLTIFMKKILTE